MAENNIAIMTAVQDRSKDVINSVLTATGDETTVNACLSVRELRFKDERMAQAFRPHRNPNEDIVLELA